MTKTTVGRRLVGTVVSDKMEKTVVVKIVRLVKDTLYKKVVRRATKVLAHDENNECQIGDTVTLKETRPISKRKSFVVAEIKKIEQISAPVISDDATEIDDQTETKEQAS